MNSSISLKQTIPIFRIFDVKKALEFYIDYLGFQVDWEHRFEEGFPLYMQVSRGDCIIHLTEHHGDSTPGSAIRVEIQNIEEFHKELASKNYAYARPGLEETPWKTREIRVGDPFHNHLLFYEFTNES